MAVNERYTFPDQVWFDAANPGPLHDALRLDYARAKAAVDRRPSLRRHMVDCEVCQTIAAAVAGSPSPISSRKRIKLIINQPQMHALLGLPGHFEIVHMFTADDPNTVTVLVAGEGLPDVPVSRETPIVPLDSFSAPDVTGRTGDGAS